MLGEITQSTLGINKGWLFAAGNTERVNFVDYLLSLVKHCMCIPNDEDAHPAVTDCNQPFQPARKSIRRRLISSGFSS